MRVPLPILIGVLLLGRAVQSQPAATLSYELKTVGPHEIYAGYDMYLTFKAEYADPPLPANVPKHLYIKKIELPAGFKWDVSCDYTVGCWKDEQGTFDYDGIDKVLLHIVAPAEAEAGQATLTMVTDSRGVGATLTYPLNVVRPPPIQRAPVTTIPPIPGLKQWETLAKNLGHKWCDEMGTLSFGAENQVWYYDGARVYFQLADYTHDPFWSKCAFSVADQYRDYILPNKGLIPGWRVFGKGLRMAYERSGQTGYKDAAISIAEHSAFAGLGGGVSDTLVRENAYLVDAYVEAEKLGAPRAKYLSRTADYLLGYFQLIFVDHKYTYHQTFFDGLAAEALIEYYELTHDPRVPPAIKLALDGLWSGSWDHKKHALAYNPDPPGPTCEIDCQNYITDLINLVAPAYAWYWNLTGDPVYQQRGDDMFSHSLASGIDYSGKIYSQNFRWSYAYVAWRSGRSNQPSK